jgi:divalent metal cation (Fe/Co/Zn/Cd) transporter
VAIGVALNIVREGAHLVWRASQGLMDEALEPQMLRTIDEVLTGFAAPEVRFDHLRTRRAGQSRYLDMHLHLPADWSLSRAAALRLSVERALVAAVPGLRASIQLLPTDVEVLADGPEHPA